jgi:hypothetical protein
METVVTGQFRVERSRQPMPLLGRHNAPIRQPGEHLRVAVNRFDQWSPDEHGMEWAHTMAAIATSV